jgi:2,3-dihydroxy-p-cumate/2,3-dihydroxybenzoate 3,4-dioxygenase
MPTGRKGELMRARGPESFGAARIEVPDLDASVKFYEEFVGLETVHRENGRALLRAGLLHHALELVHTPGRDRAQVVGVAYTVESPEVLDGIKGRVEESGRRTVPLSDSLKPFCIDGFAVEDPNGMLWEFLLDYHTFVEPPFLAFTPLHVMHPFFVTDRYEDTVRFARDVVGLQTSDYVGDTVAFLRAEDRYHHSLAVMRGESFRVDHISFIVGSFDDLMRARAKAIYHHVTIQMDLVKHSGSGTIAVYMVDPLHGPQIELSFGHRRLTEEEHESYRSRRLAWGARTELDLWRYADDDWRGFQ